MKQLGPFYRCHICGRLFDEIAELEEHGELTHTLQEYADHRFAVLDEIEHPNPWDEYSDLLEVL